MGKLTLPVLYSFRRCPYAIRARLALHISGIAYELREIQLRRKPDCMLTASPKGSVPVLLRPDGQVIDESWDIMLWALQQHDPENWRGPHNRYQEEALPWVTINDSTFKAALDRYKYADLHPAQPQSHYRAQGEVFLQQLENKLQTRAYLLGNHLSIADAAIFSFIRQFAAVDQDWFDQAPYPRLRDWTHTLIASALFTTVMQKHPVWHSGGLPIFVGGGGSSHAAGPPEN